MNVKRLLLAAAVLAILGVMVLRTFPKKPVVDTKSVVQSQNWETKTDEQPPVMVKVTPLELSADVAAWKFKIAFDTHYGDLTDDALQVATLVDDRGNVYAPTAWDGPGPGGHHREGVLAFEAINPVPSYVELKIKNVGDVPERSFLWQLEK